MSKKYIDRLKKMNDYFKDAPRLDAYEIENIVGIAEEFYKRLPYKVGKEVILTRTPDINEKDSWGWMPYKHFLVKGAKGTIEEISFFDGKVRLLIQFYNQTYICDWGDNKGKKIPLDKPGNFMFSEDDVVLV